jgi:acid phosphatase type 7
VLGLGDFQYDVGTPATFAAYYTPTWGRFKNITYPINGGGEDSFGTGDWLAYFNDGGPVTLRPEGSYSFNVGAWHIVALNSHCFERASCDEAAWTEWLRADLAANPARCTLAYWHLPYFTSPTAGEDGRPSLRAWFDVLHAAGVDVLLQAHQHLYERFTPQRGDGRRDDAGGITTFTVGTGGASHVPPIGRAANSVALEADTYGVLALTLRPAGFDFRFVPEPGKTFADAGSAACH